jgi:hypothetical protein
LKMGVSKAGSLVSASDEVLVTSDEDIGAHILVLDGEGPKVLNNLGELRKQKIQSLRDEDEVRVVGDIA